MAHGGKREGSGRKVGALTKRTRAVAEGAAATGETPLDYMLRVMRNGMVDDGRRDEMAKAAAPYIHSKLANMQVTGADGGSLVVEIVKRTYAETPDAPDAPDAGEQ